jgi:hypothetical protein
MNIKQVTMTDDIHERIGYVALNALNYFAALPSCKGEGGLGFLRMTIFTQDWLCKDAFYFLISFHREYLQRINYWSQQGHGNFQVK